MTGSKSVIGISLLIASSLLLGCDADTRDDCGGVGDVVSCLSIDSIVPVEGGLNSATETWVST